MNISVLPINELLRYENNPRNNADAVSYVAESIKDFGFKVPIVIDRQNVIVAGDTRYQAAKKLGLKEVPCIIADDLTDEQVKAYRLADNKVHEYSDWDFDLLQSELASIEFDMSKFLFREAETKKPKEKSVADRTLICPKCGCEFYV